MARPPKNSPNICCVSFCNTSGNTIKKGTNIEFHGFPKDPELLKKWVENIQCPGTELKLPKLPKICSCHFKEEDFIPTAFEDLKVLKRSAIPSCFPWNSGK